MTPAPTALPTLDVQLPPAPTYPTASPTLTPTVPPSPTPSSPPPTLAPLPTATVAVLESDVIVAYRKSGGIAGILETLTVHADGTVRLEARRAEPRELQASPADLEPLRALLTSAEFAQIKPRYEAMGDDLFVAEITVPTASGPRTIVTMSGAPSPPVLERTLVELQRLRERF